MAEFDFEATRQWARFDPRTTLARRRDAALPFVDTAPVGGQGLLLDTCVYIDQMQDRSPQVLDDLIAQRQVNHSTVAIQELMHTVGALDPSAARTAGVVAEIGKQIKAMPPIGFLRRTSRSLEGPRCFQGSCVASRDMKGTAGDARCRTACCSSRHRSSAWSCSPRMSATTISSFSSSPPDGRSSIVRNETGRRRF